MSKSLGTIMADRFSSDIKKIEQANIDIQQYEEQLLALHEEVFSGEMTFQEGVKWLFNTAKDIFYDDRGRILPVKRTDKTLN
jgi:hypothetical protein